MAEEEWRIAKNLCSDQNFVLFLASNDVKVLEIWSIYGYRADVVAR